MSLNRAKKQTKRKLVGKVGERTPGMTKKFTLSNGKHNVEAMLLNYRGSLHAYPNRCPHIGIYSDWVITNFLLWMAGTLRAPTTARPWNPPRESASGVLALAPRSRGCPSR